MCCGRQYVTGAVLALTAAFCGCATVDIGVSNPVPGLSRVAIVPFFNLSNEPAADGRRFADAYFAELQKTPGFQVVPVGVSEAAIQDSGLNLNDPDDVLELARLLDVDAVVVGAVTAYDPYYPPKVGLRVSWYSPYPWAFSPGIPTDPRARPRTCPPPIILPAVPGLSNLNLRQRAATAVGAWPFFRGTRSSEAAEDDCTPESVVRGQSPEMGLAMSEFDPRRPLMSYTRMFDGADANLTAALRDYVELSDDLRSGSWQGYLHRSDDFLKFTARLMIDEMLALHGGETRHRVVFGWRKHH